MLGGNRLPAMPHAPPTNTVNAKVFKDAPKDTIKTLKSTSKTVSVQLPPTTFPWRTLMDRVSKHQQPTRSGYINRDDPAYNDSWSKEEDALIVQLMHTTAEGRMQNFDKLTAEHLQHRRSRDVRIRYQTLLKPRMVQTVHEREVVQMRKVHGNDLQPVNGRWCVVPSGLASPLPSDRVQSLSLLTMNAGTGALTKSALNRGQRSQLSQQKVGISSLDYACQILVECAIQDKHKQSTSPEYRHALSQQVKAGQLALSKAQWSEEEDMCLREAYEVFGNKWQSVSRGLTATKRTADECRQRIEQTHQL